jgi:peptide/nickel transport system substrate-binding protein
MIIPKKENIFLKIRDNLWNYPYQIFDKDGFLSRIFSFYKMLRPFSHIVVFSALLALIGVFSYSTPTTLVKGQTEILIEGVITGESTISRINPLLPTNKQLEIDLSGLIYLPLVRVNSSEELEGVLARSVKRIDEEGKEYEFYLRDNIYWHDGQKFTADDVLATFEVLKALGGGEDKSIISKHAELATEVEVVKVDNYTVSIKLEEILPTFFEDINFGILPKHILDNVSLSTFSWARFNLNPIGTGPFIFASNENNTIILIENEGYFGKKPNIKQIQIKMYTTGDEAVEALKSGAIHTLVDPSTSVLLNLSNWPNIDVVKSASLYRRYLGLYFNLKEGGLEVFTDIKVRQAISSLINREVILEQVETAGEEALGPIPVNSWAYNSEATRFTYDPVNANDLLDGAGWELKEVGDKNVRMKNDEILRFELSYLDKYDRQVVAEAIKSDLEKLGIIVNLDPRSSSDLNEALIATRNFEAVLYGVETPIDPDRIRLWHSEAIDYPGLNLSSYVSGKKGAVVGEEKELERISLIDASLENGRSSLDREKRVGSTGLSIGYSKFQEIILEECPVVFLYHPVFTYAAHSRVKGIDLTEMTAPEDRYLSVSEWYIE